MVFSWIITTNIPGRSTANQYQFSGSSQIETWSKLDFKNYLNKSYQELDLQKEEMKKFL
jgi:hypothetical protein